MRIISGNSKGKKLLEPKDKVTRPLKDLTKESIFNIIQHSNKFKVEVDNSNILDLFSGVGSFGLECLSRNASSVTFIENYKEALLVLKKNIEDLNYSNSTLVIEKNIFSQFKFESLKKKYDIIFLDPPYKEKNMNSLIVSIDASKILNNNGILIVHRHKKEKDEFPKNFNILEKKNYGISKIIFGNFT
tara:strand:+ start:1254 stop:1817 length:564 start_codon:yes stop_codon:yes gene_type:complete